MKVLELLSEMSDTKIQENIGDFSQIPHEPGHLYHASSRDFLFDIADAGKLNTFRPWHGTDQEAWPDGSTERRSYWGPTPKHVESFIPDFPPGIIRARVEHVNARPERGTGDFYARKPVPSKHLEYFDGNSWVPLDHLRAPRINTT